MNDALTLQVLLAAGDRELEARLVTALPAEGVTIAARCLDSDSLLERASPVDFDAVLVATGLHGLGPSTLHALRDRRLRVLVLAGDERQVGRFADLAPTLPMATPAPAIAEALRRVQRGHEVTGCAGPTAGQTLDNGRDDSDPSSPHGQVIAVVSGKGAPGKSTIAISLAQVLGASGRSVTLVDADLRGGNVAPYLDLDPRRGLVGLTTGADELDARLEAELQPGPDCAVLAGLERSELAEMIPQGLIAGALAALRDRYERVVVDLADPPLPEALRAASTVLVVTGADLVSVWNARLALPALRSVISAPLQAVVNRREGREHYDADEIARALAMPVLGTVREDRRAARRAIERQAPLSSVGGHVAHDLRRLAHALETAPAPSAVDADRSLAPRLAEA